MIRKFVAIAALCLVGFMAAAMPTIAAPYDDVCVLDLSQPADVLHVISPDGEDCLAIVADVRLDPTSLGGDQGEDAPALCSIASFSTPLPAYRHEDPGRFVA
jgi:hypothetical protein